MNQCRVSDAARSDLEDIWCYIAQDDPEAAVKFVCSLVSQFPKLAAMPGMGRQRGELSPHLRSFPFRRYLIFYRPLKDGIEIARVLHGARDVPPLFE